jgi:ABC-type Fe3+-siderophore transport system permease subunit
VPAGRRLPFAVVVVAGAVLLVAGGLAALRVGDVAVAWSQIGEWLRGLDVPVVDRRFARFAVAAAAGACLAVAGVAVQSVVRNPIAEPSIIGVTGGAGVGAVAVLTIAPDAPSWALPLGALAGGIGTTALLLLAAGRRSGGSLTVDPTRVVLVGIGLSAFATAVIVVLALHVQLAVNRAIIWIAGSTYGRTFDDARWLIPPLVLVVVLAVLGRSLDLLAYGDDMPRSLGLGLGRARLAVLMSGAFLAAGAASVVGTVGFVGLVAPHTARALVGPAHRRLIPVAALFGAVLVVAADVVGRTLLAPKEIPVGLVVALVGAPYLAWLLRRSQRGSLR